MKYFDLHCDTISECCKRKLDLYDNPLHISLKKATCFQSYIQCFAIWLDDSMPEASALEFFLDCHRYFVSQVELNKHRLKWCQGSKDLRQARQDGITGAILTVEGGTLLNGDLRNIALLKEMGVQAITLTWNGKNRIGDGCLVPDGKGLTSFGLEAVREMQNRGIAVDVSHLNDEGFYDVAKTVQGPFIATHSNSRAVCAHPRNLTDEQFQIIRDAGGIVGVNLYPAFLCQEGKAEESDILRHIEHFLALNGEDILCFGSDFDGAVMPECISDISCILLFYQYLKEKGYEEELLDKLFYKNAYNFFMKTLTKN